MVFFNFKNHDSLTIKIKHLRNVNYLSLYLKFEYLYNEISIIEKNDLIFKIKQVIQSVSGINENDSEIYLSPLNDTPNSDTLIKITMSNNNTYNILYNYINDIGLIINFNNESKLINKLYNPETNVYLINPIIEFSDINYSKGILHIIPKKNIFKQLYYKNIYNLNSLSDIQYVQLNHKNCPQDFNFCWGLNNVHYNIVITRSIVINNKMYLLLDNDESFKISYTIVIDLDKYPSTDSISFIDLDLQKKIIHLWVF